MQCMSLGVDGGVCKDVRIEIWHGWVGWDELERCNGVLWCMRCVVSSFVASGMDECSVG